MSNDAPQSSLARMISGYWLSQAIYAVAKLGLADLLHDAPQTAAQLAPQTNTLPQPLYRLLRALASVGVFHEDSSANFSRTELGQLLRSDVPGSQRAMAMMTGEEHYQSWGQLLYSLQTGQPGFNKVYGLPVFDYLAQHPRQATVFDAAMVAMRRTRTACYYAEAEVALAEASTATESWTKAQVAFANANTRANKAMAETA